MFKGFSMGSINVKHSTSADHLGRQVCLSDEWPKLDDISTCFSNKTVDEWFPVEMFRLTLMLARFIV